MFIFFNILFEFIIFQNVLLKFIPIFGKIDEVILGILIILSLIKIAKEHNKCKNKVYIRRTLFYKEEINIAKYMGLFLISGIFSTIALNIQPIKIAILKDILAISKFFIFYLTALYLSSEIDKEKLLKSISKRIRIYLYIIFIFGVINLFFDIGMSQGTRYGIRYYSFLFTHPTYLVLATILMLSILKANSIEKKNKYAEFSALMILSFTLRSKALIFIVIYLLVEILGDKLKEIKIKHLTIFGVIGFIITLPKALKIFSWGYTAARPALYLVGVELAIKYFPVGSGFGTFASALSGQYYSTIYYNYKINHVMGLTPDMYLYMADTFWPYIYGQFGVLGFVLFILTLVQIFKSLKSRYILNKQKTLAAYLIFIYVLVASTAEAVFTDALGSLTFVILAVYLGNNYIKKA